MSLARVLSVLFMVTEHFPCLVLCVNLAMLSIGHPLISAILIGSFHCLHGSLYHAFDCANSGLLVSCWKSQFAENFLNSNMVNSGSLSERLVCGFYVLQTLFSYALLLLVRCFRRVWRFQNNWSNNSQQWGRLSLEFWTVSFRLLSGCVRDLMVHEQFSVLTVFILCACLTVWYRICYVFIHVWPEKWLYGLRICFTIPGGLGSRNVEDTVIYWLLRRNPSWYLTSVLLWS